MARIKGETDSVAVVRARLLFSYSEKPLDCVEITLTGIKMCDTWSCSSAPDAVSSSSSSSSSWRILKRDKMTYFNEMTVLLSE